MIFKSCKFNIVVCVFFLSLTIHAWVRAETRVLSPEVLLRKVNDELTKRNPVAFDSETIITFPDRIGKAGEVTKRRTISSFRHNADRIDLVRTRYDTVNGKERPAIGSRGIWDGKMLLFRQKLLNEPTAVDLAYIDRDMIIADIMMGIDRPDGYLDGFLGDTEHYASTMLKSTNLNMLNDREKIKGYSCYVIEASGKYGSYKVWIDPECGYNFRKALMWKKAGNLRANGKPLSSEETESIKFAVENVKLENVDETWVPIAGTADKMKVYKGNEYHYQYTSIRSNISLKPDFIKMNAFKMDLPEGTKIKDYDAPDTQFVWRNGKVQKLSEVLETLRNQQSPPLIIEQWYNGNFWQLDFEDKVILLDFWGGWCNPCIKQIPFLKKLSAKYSTQGLVVVGIHTQLKKEDIETFISQKGVSYLIGVDCEDKTSQMYKVSAYPTIFLIDRKDFIRAANPNKEELEELIISLLKPDVKVDSREH